MIDPYRREYDNFIIGPGEDETSKGKLIYRRRARKRVKRQWKKEHKEEEKCKP